MQKLDRLVWAGSSTFKVGDLHLGVRSSSPAVHDVLRAALAAHLVEGVDAPPNYSVQLAGHDLADGESSDFHFLYRGFNAVVRTRDVHRLVSGLFAHMSTHGADDGSSLRMDTVAFVGDGHALIAPPDLRQAMAALERRLNIKGMRVVDLPWSLIDPDSGELIVPEPAMKVDAGALAGLDAIAGSTGSKRRRPDPAVAPGRYPVVGWAFGRGQAGAGPLTTSVAVAEAARLIANVPAVGAERALAGLTAVMASLDPVALWSDKPEGLVAPLLALAS